MAPQSVRSMDVVYDDDTLSKALANASSIADLVASIPHTWRSACGDKLTTIYRVASKLCTVQNTIAQYDRHTTDGSFPASIRNAIRDPKVQFSKEFLGTSEGSLAPRHLDAVINAARKSLLAEAVTRKKEELATLQRLIAFDQTTWRNSVLEVAKRVGQTFGITVNTDGQTAPSWTGGPVPKDVKRDCDWLWTRGQSYHYRAVALARAVADRTLVDKVKTLTIKKDTDVAMRDADTELSTRDVVRDEMQAQMRLLETRLARSMNQGRKSAPQKKGGSNPSRVKKGSPNGQGKGKKNKQRR